MAFFGTQITRIVRGFLSRRLLLNFYDRRRVVEQRMQKGQELRETLQARLASQLEAKADDEEERARKQFATAAEGLHHLVSTRAQPGIYNPPYAMGAADVPSAFNVPLEEHLRDGAKRFVRTHGLSSQRWPRPMSREERRALRAVVEVGGSTALKSLRADVERLERSGTLRPIPPGGSGLPRTAPRAMGGVDVVNAGPEAMAVMGAGSARLRGTAPLSSGVQGKSSAGMYGRAGAEDGPLGAAAADAADADELAELEGAANMHGFEGAAARRIRHQRAQRPSRTGGSERDPPPVYVDNPRSLQATAPYGIEAEAAREGERQRRVARVAVGEFRAGGLVPPARHAKGVHASAPYEEPWKAGRSTRELEHTAESKAQRVSSKPFVSTAGLLSSFEAAERRRARSRMGDSGRGAMARAGMGVVAARGAAVAERGGSARSAQRP